MIEIQNAVKRYRDITVLNNVSVHFETGRIYGIIGRNGSGKTVLFKCICGLIPLTLGSIRIEGKQIGKDIDVPPDVGAIIEEPGFFPGYSGACVLRMLTSIRSKISPQEIDQTMELVGLNPKERKHVSCYSRGMRQRLGIAQAILGNPSLLILDEPMNGLDEEGVAEMRTLFRSLKTKGITILLSSHNFEDIETLCDSIYEMKQGSLFPYPLSG